MMVNGKEHFKGVALKRSLEERGASGCGPEAKKMAGGQAAPGALGANPNAVTEEWSVPDKMVGLIIGRDGKQIMKLQQESQCKVQLSSESNGTSERPCTLTGSKQAVEKAKELISALITRGQEALHKGAMNGGGGGNQGDITLDVPCPGHKAGLVIGRGGETIRGLQDRAGVKMVVVQESSMPPHIDKPIRITGEPAKVEFAKKLVLDLINGSAPQNGGGPGGGGSGGHLERGGGGGFPSGQMGGPGGLTPAPGEPGMLQEQLIVPRQAVGVVIGKQGDTIKRIQLETGARVQFQTPVDESQPDRICLITGHQQQQVVLACNHISDLISSVLRRDDENGGPSGGSGGSLGGLGGMGRGAGRGISGRGAIRGSFRGGRGGGRGGPMAMSGGHLGSPGGSMAGSGGLGAPGSDQQEAQMQVAANKCGLVIGKGGESIRHIMHQSGAYIELSRVGGHAATEKFFTIRGTPQSIEVAQQLISEKIGSAGNSGPPGSGMMTGGGANANGSTPGGYQPGYGSQTSYAAQGGGQYGGAVATAPGQSAWGQPGPYQAPTAANGTAQWGQPSTAATPNGDLSKPQDNSTAWAAFYHQYYQQPGGAHPGGAPTAAGGGSAAANPSAPPSTGPSGQPDYSQAWIDYYRQLGMFQEAELIERQTRGGAQANPAAQQPQPQPQAGAPGGPSGVAQNGAPWGAAPYAAPGAPYGGAPAAPQPYGTYGYPSA
ncbi:far upstream element-binding protein 3-like [Tropilaelaps mercedesae]|uniref:Far upstream element-binding protein 3-like n=1 Tax=Tropilaelaps mercedesae TaxID=418985 RepID=A0A1V9XV03_9ACAR|nr:far upstream element-binding protein 3-like [Tropilaelaps mercedesae]